MIGRPFEKGNKMGAKVATKRPRMRPAINAKCLDCSGGSRAEVARCVVTACSLYPLRPKWKARLGAGAD